MKRRFLVSLAAGAWLAACVGQRPAPSSAPGSATPPGTPSAPTTPGAASTERHPGGPDAGVDPSFFVFLLIGQSNMEGAPKPEAADLTEDPRVLVLAYDDCPALGRVHDRWYTARPPLHGCNAGLGPGDGFARAVAAAFPNATIGLVPSAISGVDIDFFRKGVVSKRRQEFRIPPDNRAAGAYDWVLERARLAQKSGVVRGILFHQGESDTGSAEWVEKVSGMVADLRADLALGPVPFVAGELLHGGCCASHNPLVNQLPLGIPNALVVSAEGLAGIDRAHFDVGGQRELGKRYAQKMLSALAD
jgi:hypothetical protein